MERARAPQLDGDCTLEAGCHTAQADAEMRSIGQALAREYPETNEKVGAFVAPLRDHFVRGSRRILTLLFCSVAMVLLIACSNLANLLLSRAAARRKEISVRAALGAGTWDIARRFVCESLLVSAGQPDWPPPRDKRHSNSSHTLLQET